MSRARDMANGVTTFAPLASPTFTGTPNLGSNPTVTLGSNTTFPAGHVIQMKATTIAMTAINGGYTANVPASDSFEGVSASDLTLNRTANTHVLYSLQGGGPYIGTSGHSLFILGRRTSGTSYTGTATNLGDSTYGHCRHYASSSPLIVPISVVAHDTVNISGNWTYRFFYRFSSADHDFGNTDRGEINVTIMEFNPS